VEAGGEAGKAGTQNCNFHVNIPKVLQKLVFGFEKAPRTNDRKPLNIYEYQAVYDRSFPGAFSLPKINF
jgi:hypothetical protein